MAETGKVNQESTRLGACAFSKVGVVRCVGRTPQVRPAAASEFRLAMGEKRGLHTVAVANRLPNEAVCAASIELGGKYNKDKFSIAGGVAGAQ